MARVNKKIWSFIRKAKQQGITLSPDDFGPDGTIDGIEPARWIREMAA